MDGQRLIGGTFLLILATTIGCTHTGKTPEQPGLPQPNANRPSLLESSGLLGKKSPAFPASPPDTPVARSSDHATELKPETEAAFAAAEVEAAFAPDRSTVARDAMLDRARQRYQSALKKDPNNKAALVGLARMYAKSGDKDRAAEALQHAIRAFPEDHDLCLKLASTYIQFADWPAAILSCQQALQGDPENRTYKKTLAYCQAVHGEWDAAFGTILDVLPEAEARYFLGRVLVDLQRYDAAKQQMELALKADEQFQPAQLFFAKLAAGMTSPSETGPIVQAGAASPQYPQNPVVLPAVVR
ncbi:MAG: tetratricopeptide repeat protein [Bacteroidales bacterium]|nr:tetratricopeptide repeat protein [Bacteroidales bacterium]